MSTAIRRGIYGKLAGDTTLNNLLGTPPSGWSKSIYYEVAPEHAAYPLVIFSKQSGLPSQAFGVPSALDTDLWLVKCIDKSTTADAAEGAAERITALLNDAQLSLSNASLLYLRRDSDVDYSEVVDGVVYRHTGSLFRLITSST